MEEAWIHTQCLMEHIYVSKFKIKMEMPYPYSPIANQPSPLENWLIYFVLSTLNHKLSFQGGGVLIYNALDFLEPRHTVHILFLYAKTFLGFHLWIRILGKLIKENSYSLISCFHANTDITKGL